LDNSLNLLILQTIQNITKQITMKKVLGILAIAAVFTACAGGENKEATADTTAVTVDTTTAPVVADTTAATADTTAKVDTAAAAH